LVFLGIESAADLMNSIWNSSAIQYCGTGHYCIPLFCNAIEYFTLWHCRKRNRPPKHSKKIFSNSMIIIPALSIIDRSISSDAVGAV
jgi:hypothetical protein